MTDNYPAQTVIDFEKRFIYTGKGALWLNVPRENDFPAGEDPIVPPVVLSYSGNTIDIPYEEEEEDEDGLASNPTLTRFKPRPATGLYTKSDNLIEIRDAKESPIKNTNCGDVPMEWRFNDQSAGFTGAIKYSNNPLIDELFDLPTAENASVNDKIRGYGGTVTKPAIGALAIRSGIVANIFNIYQCTWMFGPIKPASKAVSAKGFTTLDIKFLAQMINKVSGGHEKLGYQLALRWYVRIKANGDNEVLSPAEVFALQIVP